MSHQASRTAAQLDDIDLLPRIKERTLLTPELAPVFRSRGTEVNLPRILRGVLARGGAASTPDLVETTGLTHPTVRHYMRLLGERGVAVPRRPRPRRSS